MSYTQQQRSKNRETVDRLMAGNSHQQRVDVLRILDASWANDDEAIKIINRQIEVLKDEAGPGDDAFKNLRV